MKKFLISLALLTSPLLVMAGADIGITINLGEPNYYGPLKQLNNLPPQVLFAQPVIIQRAPGMINEPLYLRVPPGHYKRWSRHCSAYNACNRPVFFVTETWYNNRYVPQYRGQGYAHGHDRDDGQGYGYGNGNGRGHGRGH